MITVTVSRHINSLSNYTILPILQDAGKMTLKRPDPGQIAQNLLVILDNKGTVCDGRFFELWERTRKDRED